MTFKSRAMIMRPLLIALIFFFSLSVIGASWEGESETVGPEVVKREQRKSLVETEYGEVSAAYISDGTKGPYHVHFFSLEPDSLFLPVLVHSDMVLYVDSGRGKLSWTDEDKLRSEAVRRGDVFTLVPGSVFYVHSSSDPDPQGDKLRFFAFFANSDENPYEPSVGAYSRLSNMVTDLDAKVLQSAFNLSPEVAEEIANATDPPAIVRAGEEMEDESEDLLVPFSDVYNKQKKKKEKKKEKKYTPFNILETEPDFENCYGWTLNVNDKKLQSLKGSNLGIFVVNITRGSMMAPHWNPKATEVLVVLQGEGMIRISCSGIAKDRGCKSARFKVRQGDVFAVPKFHPMAQMSFNSEQFVLMGFSTESRDSDAQFVAGKRSVLQILERTVLAKAFNVANTTVDQLLASQQQSPLLDCTSCAEAEEMKMEEPEQREEEEEEETERGRRAARILKLARLVV